MAACRAIHSWAVLVKSLNASSLRLALVLFCLACLLIFLGGCQSIPTSEDAANRAERTAIDFLAVEVPGWKKENGCFSCHNNGDGARALFHAKAKGRAVPKEALADTIEWLSRPAQWDDNHGDPGFADKRLGDIQFASSLLTAQRAGIRFPREAMRLALQRLRDDQQSEGAFVIEGQSATGSPATYGSVLATAIALEVFRGSDGVSTNSFAGRGHSWLLRQPLNNHVSICAVLPFLPLHDRADLVTKLVNAQTAEGGWGPYPDAPAEVFDTALVMLALGRERAGGAGIKKARGFLARMQNPDGSWPATTRPSGGQSYAQTISTTAWAVIALVETAPR